MKTKMKTSLIVATFVAAGMAAVAGSAAMAAGTSDSDTGAATATMVKPITIAADAGQGLDFGTFTTTAAGSVTVDTAGGATYVAVSPLAGATTAGKFDVDGQASATYTITLPANGTVTLSDGGSATMAVDDFTSAPAAGPASPPGNGLLDSGGAQVILVGAKLSVSATQTPGSYTGSYSVAVAYP